MKGSAKLFIASLIVFAASAGFFAGSVCMKPCPKGPMAMEGFQPGMMPSPPGFDGKNPPPEMKGPMGQHGPKGHRGPHGPNGPDRKMMDSLLQVTADQKVALEKNRTEAEETLKTLRKNKFEAEKALGEALNTEDIKAIETAKANVLSADKALLDHRINSIAALNKILTKEQREKFRAFHKEAMKKFKDHKGHGPKPGMGPDMGPKFEGEPQE